MGKNFACMLVAVLALTSFAVVPATAMESPPEKNMVDETVLNAVKEWLANPVVGISIESQNRKYASVSEQSIDDLDKQWREETKKQDQPLIAAILSSPLSNYLTQIQAASAGLYTEIFIMDAKGLNVGQSSITSDFWQGDEAKFQKTYNEGVNVVFVDEPEFHEATKTWRVQVNMTISNEKQQPIGAITVEYNLTELARRKNSV